MIAIISAQVQISQTGAAQNNAAESKSAENNAFTIFATFEIVQKTVYGRPIEIRARAKCFI